MRSISTGPGAGLGGAGGLPGQHRVRGRGGVNRHAFVQNLRRGHYEIATHEPAGRRLAVAFTELAKVI
jgi:hypothetical protein